MPPDFLRLSGKTFLVMGVANRKSVAYAIAAQIEAAGGEVIYAVRSESRRESTAKLLAGKKVIVCDVERQAEIDAMAAQLTRGQRHAGRFGPFDRLRRLFRRDQTVSRNHPAAIFAGDRHLGVFGSSRFATRSKIVWPRTPRSSPSASRRRGWPASRTASWRRSKRRWNRRWRS